MTWACNLNIRIGMKGGHIVTEKEFLKIIASQQQVKRPKKTVTGAGKSREK